MNEQDISELKRELDLIKNAMERQKELNSCLNENHQHIKDLEKNILKMLGSERKKYYHDGMIIEVYYSGGEEEYKITISEINTL